MVEIKKINIFLKKIRFCLHMSKRTSNFAIAKQKLVLCNKNNEN